MTALEIVGLSVVYGCIGFICARLIAGHLAYMWRNKEQERYTRRITPPPSGDMWFGAWCLGLLVGTVWPLALLIHRLNLEKYAMGAERTALRKRQEQRIQELEKELKLS